MSERQYQPDRTVYIDMDGVIAGFDEEAVRRVEQMHPDFIGDKERVNFYIADDYPEFSDSIRQVCAQEGFFRAFPVIEGAVEGWGKIESLGWQPRILSAPLRSNATSEVEKRQWLAEHFDPVFGSHVSRDAVIDKAKFKYDGIALIDDRPQVENSEVATWQHIVMGQSYNQHIDTEYRLTNWYDTRLNDLLIQAQQRYLRRLGTTAL